VMPPGPHVHEGGLVFHHRHTSLGVTPTLNKWAHFPRFTPVTGEVPFLLSQSQVRDKQHLLPGSTPQQIPHRKVEMFS
jgi:hypothetical protein